MPKVVIDQDMLTLQLFQRLEKHLHLAVMNGDNVPDLRIHRSIAQLQQLSGECSAARSRDDLLLSDLEQHIGLELLVSLRGFGIQDNRYVVVDPVGQFEIVLGLHADADVGQLLIDCLLSSILERVREYRGPAALVRDEVNLAVY